MHSLVSTIAIVLGTSVAMATALIGLARWAVGAMLQQQLAKHFSPLATSMAELTTTVQALTESLKEAKEAQRADHAASAARADEIHRAVVALERLVAQHETAICVHDTQIGALQQAILPVEVASPPRPVIRPRPKRKP